MIIKISNFIFKNIVIKLVSVVLAIVLWFMVVNVTNPTSTRIYNLSLSISNQYKLTESNYVLLNEADLKNVTVDINIRSTRDDFAELSKYESRMRAYIDLGPIDISKTARLGVYLPITVKVNLPSHLASNRFEILNINPMTVDVVLDRLVTEDFPVSVEKIGDAAAGYVFLQPVTEPETIQITGAQSIIDTISSVRADVAVSGASDYITETKALTVLDKVGADITSDVKLNVDSVEVNIPINKTAKVPISEPEIYGEPAQGAQVTSITWEPKSIEIVGNEEDVNSIADIELAPISIEGSDSTIIETYDLRNNILAAKSNCNVLNGTPHEVIVTINIEREAEKEINLIQEGIICLGAPAAFSLDSDDIALTISGLQKVLDETLDSDVSAILDLTGLEPGTHELKAQIYLPAGVKLVGEEPSIKVTIPPEVSNAASESTPTQKPRPFN